MKENDDTNRISNHSSCLSCKLLNSLLRLFHTIVQHSNAIFILKLFMLQVIPRLLLLNYEISYTIITR